MAIYDTGADSRHLLRFFPLPLSSSHSKPGFACCAIRSTCIWTIRADPFLLYFTLLSFSTVYPVGGAYCLCNTSNDRQKLVPPQSPAYACRHRRSSYGAQYAIRNHCHCHPAAAAAAFPTPEHICRFDASTGVPARGQELFNSIYAYICDSAGLTDLEHASIIIS